jgi:hypothetical protein
MSMNGPARWKLEMDWPKGEGMSSEETRRMVVDLAEFMVAAVRREDQYWELRAKVARLERIEKAAREYRDAVEAAPHCESDVDTETYEDGQTRLYEAWNNLCAALAEGSEDESTN